MGEQGSIAETDGVFWCLKDCLKDLQRFLRQDDPLNREAFMHLGKQNIVKSDLIPLIMGYVDELDIVYNARKSHDRFPQMQLHRLMECIWCLQC